MFPRGLANHVENSCTQVLLMPRIIPPVHAGCAEKVKKQGWELGLLPRQSHLPHRFPSIVDTVSIAIIITHTVCSVQR